MTEAVGAARARVLLDLLEQEIVDLDAVVAADAEVSSRALAGADDVPAPGETGVRARSAGLEPPD